MKCHKTWKHKRTLWPEKTDTSGVLGPSPKVEVLWIQNHFGVGCEELDLLSVCSQMNVMEEGGKHNLAIALSQSLQWRNSIEISINVTV